MAAPQRMRRLTAPPTAPAAMILSTAPAAVAGSQPVGPLRPERRGGEALSDRQACKQRAWSPGLFQEEAPTVIEKEVFEMIDGDNDGYVTLADVQPMVGAARRASLRCWLQRCREPSRGFTIGEFAACFRGDECVEAHYMNAYHETTGSRPRSPEFIEQSTLPSTVSTAAPSPLSARSTPPLSGRRHSGIGASAGGSSLWTPTLYAQEFPGMDAAQPGNPAAAASAVAKPAGGKGGRTGIMATLPAEQWEETMLPAFRRAPMAIPSQAVYGTMSEALAGAGYRRRRLSSGQATVQQRPIGADPGLAGAFESRRRQRRLTAPAPPSFGGLPPGRVHPRWQPVEKPQDISKAELLPDAKVKKPAALPEVGEVVERLIQAAERATSTADWPQRTVFIMEFLQEHAKALDAKRAEMVRAAEETAVPVPGDLSDGNVSAHLALQLLFGLLAKREESEQDGDENGMFDGEETEAEDGVTKAKRPRRKRGGRRVREAIERAERRRGEAERLETERLEAQAALAPTCIGDESAASEAGCSATASGSGVGMAVSVLYSGATTPLESADEGDKAAATGATGEVSAEEDEEDLVDSLLFPLGFGKVTLWEWPLTQKDKLARVALLQQKELDHREAFDEEWSDGEEDLEESFIEDDCCAYKKAGQIAEEDEEDVAEQPSNNSEEVA
eukprot:TRINITY_DN10398_c0_g1_i1.p1 TRINITY_DN10398_c0_g1~~TRINITY_DN10398_c0_g1_i1.p1  ORF type:complete len:674 (-),score=190.80 TRINITY_DN10398_c0_g1_i1:208-2229(-)